MSDSVTDLNTGLVLMSVDSGSDGGSMASEDSYQDSEYNYDDLDVDSPRSGDKVDEAATMDDTLPRTTTLYTIITPAALAAYQEGAMREVMEVLQCTMPEARRLLMYTKWNKETLLASIMGDRERVLNAAGIPPEPQNHTDESDAGEIMCRICYCDTPQDEATKMDCGHAFCNDCWQQHIRIQISDGLSRRIPCMHEDCKYHCNEDKVKLLLKDDVELKTKYETALSSSYVEDNPNVCWCPSIPHCGNAVRAEKDHFCEPSCVCGHHFCFACGDEPHSPCTCDMWAKWKKKCRDDSETQNWMRANTKPCPKCGKTVEKDGGCNLVYCPCGQPFCWLCGVATGSNHTWTEIQGHKCGANKGEMDKAIDEAARNVKRYLRYHNHWSGLRESLEAESKAGEEASKKLAALEVGGITGCFSDHSLVVQAYSQLSTVRKILANSYVFAFYMFSNTIYKEEITPQQNANLENLFELLQQDLAAAVEHTSGLLQKAGNAIDDLTPEIRLEIINITKNLDRRLTNLYHLVENDILSKLTFSPNDISYYKGVRPRGEGGMHEVLATFGQAAGPAEGFSSHESEPTLRGKRARVWS